MRLCGVSRPWTQWSQKTNAVQVRIPSARRHDTAPQPVNLPAMFWYLWAALALRGQANCHQMAGGSRNAAQSDCAATCCASDAQHGLRTSGEKEQHRPAHAAHNAPRLCARAPATSNQRQTMMSNSGTMQQVEGMTISTGVRHARTARHGWLYRANIPAPTPYRTLNHGGDERGRSSAIAVASRCECPI